MPVTELAGFGWLLGVGLLIRSGLLCAGFLAPASVLTRPEPKEAHAGERGGAGFLALASVFIRPEPKEAHAGEGGWLGVWKGHRSPFLVGLRGGMSWPFVRTGFIRWV